MTTLPTPTSAAEPLWTLAMVQAWLAEHATYDIGAAIVLASDIVYDYEEKCNRLTARIDQLAVALTVEQAQTAELREQLAEARAGSYVPLPNGIYHTDGPEVVEVADERIIVYQGARGAWANLPRGYALCRLQPASAGSEGAVTP